MMSIWIKDKNGDNVALLDGNRLKATNGAVFAIRNNDKIYLASGQCVGWFDGEDIFDLMGYELGYTTDYDNDLPTHPAESPEPPVPPETPQGPKVVLKPAPPRPSEKQWSDYTFEEYFIGMIKRSRNQK